MQVPGSIASVWYYEEVAQWALKNVVCGRVASVVGVLALSTDANWPCLVPHIPHGTVVEHHMILSLFAGERIFGCYFFLLPYPSVCGVANMLFSFRISCE